MQFQSVSSLQVLTFTSPVDIEWMLALHCLYNNILVSCTKTSYFYTFAVLSSPCENFSLHIKKSSRELKLLGGEGMSDLRLKLFCL